MIDGIARALPDVLCIDVGASYFPHARWQTFLSSPNTTWLAVDPNEQNLEYARDWAWPCRLKVLPIGLSRSGGQTDLYVTNVDSGSSLLPLDIKPSMTHRMVHLDYLFPIRKVSIPTRSLSEIVAKETGGVPILVKLDTQGSELSILEGAPELFGGNRVVGVELELTLLAEPILKGSGKFSEASEFFESRGFELLHLKPIYGPSRHGLARPKGNTYLNECDATFSLRRDIAATLPIEFRVCLLAFYVSYSFFEEAYSLLSDDRDVARFLEEHGSEPSSMEKLLVSLM